MILERQVPSSNKHVRLLTVTELTMYMKDLMENDPLLVNLWVRGEISNCKQAASSHLYFTLKDEHCCIRAIMFRSRYRNLAFQPENGLAVRIRGYVTVYERDGIYQLYVEEMEPDGTGALYLAFEQLKRKLQQEGLFEQKYKQKLPFLPRRIGIVTSPTGAVIKDMLNIIQRRWPGMEIVFLPVAVQGDTAPEEIAQAICWLNQLEDIDVIIAGRGGGSIEELWAFNTETVARAIFHSRIPVVSAVGHETDFTIADLVADVRAPTPSAAAELVVPVKDELKKILSGWIERADRAMDEYIARCRRRLETCLKSPVLCRPEQELCERKKQQVDVAIQRLEQQTSRILEQNRAILAVQVARLEALSPLTTLARGYCLCTRPGVPELLRDAAKVAPGEQVEIQLYKGRLLCLVHKRII